MIFLAGNTLEFTNVCCYSQKPSSCSKLSWIARKLKRQKEKKKEIKCSGTNITEVKMTRLCLLIQNCVILSCMFCLCLFCNMLC